MDVEMQAWQAKRDLEIMSAASAIQSDPNRLAAMKAEIDRQQKMIAGISGDGSGVTLKQVGNMSIPQFSRKGQ